MWCSVLALYKECPNCTAHSAHPLNPLRRTVLMSGARRLCGNSGDTCVVLRSEGGRGGEGGGGGRGEHTTNVII